MVTRMGVVAIRGAIYRLEILLKSVKFLALWNYFDLTMVSPKLPICILRDYQSGVISKLRTHV